MALDPQVAGILQMLAEAEGPDMTESPPEVGRELYRGMGATLDAQSVPCKVRDTTVAGPAGDIPVRVYSPETGDADVLPGIMFFHGGGFVIGDLDSHDGLCRLFAKDVGVRVIAVHYRLAPEAKFPAAPDDCFAALNAVRSRAAEFGVDPNNMAVAGDSAGGNLSAVIAQLNKAAGGAPLKYQMLIYPTTQAHADTPSMRENAEGYMLERKTMDWFFGHYTDGVAGLDMNDPKLSPINGDLAGLPPATVVTAGFDPLRDEGRAYADKLSAAGVPVKYVNYESLIHGFANMSGVVEAAKAAVDDMSRDLKAALT